MKRKRLWNLFDNPVDSSERTDPDWEDHRIEMMRREYQECPPEWRQQYLNGLSIVDRKRVTERS